MSFNQFVVVVVQWKAARCRNRYGGPLWTCESVKRCKSSSNTQNGLLMALKTYSLKDLQAILKIFKVNFVVVVVLHNQLDVRKN